MTTYFRVAIRKSISQLSEVNIRYAELPERVPSGQRYVEENQVLVGPYPGR